MRTTARSATCDEVLDRACTRAAGGRHRDAAASAGSASLAATAHVLRGAELLLSAPVVLWAALDYYRRGWMGVVNRSPNMYTLIGLGVIVAFVYSIVATFCAAGISSRNARCATAWSASTSKSRARSSLWCCSVNGWSFVLAARTSAAIRQLLGPCAQDCAPGQRATAPRRMCRSGMCMPAIGCECGRAKRFRWTAASSRADPASTSRC